MQFLVGLFVGMALMLLIIGLCTASKGGMPDAEEVEESTTPDFNHGFPCRRVL